MALRLRLQSAKQKIRPRSWAPTAVEEAQLDIAIPVTSYRPDKTTSNKTSLDVPVPQQPKSPSIIITKPEETKSRPKTDSISSIASALSGKKSGSWRKRLGHRKSKSLTDPIHVPIPESQPSIQEEVQPDEISDTETLVEEATTEVLLLDLTAPVRPSSAHSVFPPFCLEEKLLPPVPSPSATIDDSPRPTSKSSTSSSCLGRKIQFRIPEESHRRSHKKRKNHNLLTIEISSRESSCQSTPRKYVKTPLPRSPLSPARRVITSRALRAQTLIPASQLRALEKHLEAELPITPATSSGDSDSLRDLVDRLGHYSGSSRQHSDSESIAESTISDRLFEDRLLTCVRAPPPKYRRQPSGSGLSPIQASPRSPHRSTVQDCRKAHPRQRLQPSRAARRVGSWPSLKSPAVQTRSRTSSKSTVGDPPFTPSDAESTYEDRLRDIYRSALRPGRLSTRSSLDGFPPLSPLPHFKLSKCRLLQQNLFPPEQARLIHTLLERDHPHSPVISSPLRSAHTHYSIPSPRAATGTDQNMGHRKVWVKRTGGSATTIMVRDSDLVDDVRDFVLKKYGNSLGRTFDAPDINIRVVPRSGSANRSNGAERLLGPDEAIAGILDNYFKDGQSMEEALVIELPSRKTPKASPRNTPGAFYSEEHPMHLTLPHHKDYFPPTPHASHTSGDNAVTPSAAAPLQSPGRQRRPKSTRRQTQSPASSHPNSRIDEKNVESSDSPDPPPNPATLASTDFQPGRPLKLSTKGAHVRNASKANDIATSPRPMKPTADKLSSKVDRNGNTIYSTPPAHTNRPVRSDTLLLEHSGVPPINVLLVEDNMINLRLLEAFMKRLKVRYKTAVDGEQAVSRWKEGGFHLVLMDIQLPKMNGLDATRSIRNLETESGIGLGASLRALSNSETEGLRKMDSLEGQHSNGNGEIKILSSASDAGDSTASQGQTMKQVGTTNFKSPVIIVALTASSLESDRHEALAAGCNDFLTKPVGYTYLERKVMEWGCMQALIDFDGWRQWKIDAAIAQGAATKEAKVKADAKAQAQAARLASNEGGRGSGGRPGMRRRDVGGRKNNSFGEKPKDPATQRLQSEGGKDAHSGGDSRTPSGGGHPPITSSDSNDSTSGYIASMQEGYKQSQLAPPEPPLPLPPQAEDPQSDQRPSRSRRPASLSLAPAALNPTTAMGPNDAHATSSSSQQRHTSGHISVRHDLSSPLGRALSDRGEISTDSQDEDGEERVGPDGKLTSSVSLGSAKLRRFPESAADRAGDEPPAIILPNGRLDLRIKR